MPKITAFEKHTKQYESWFEENKWVYQAELKAVKALLPDNRHSLEIGVGTGTKESSAIDSGLNPFY
jgi:hypothetical protein